MWGKERKRVRWKTDKDKESQEKRERGSSKENREREREKCMRKRERELKRKGEGEREKEKEKSNEFIFVISIEVHSKFSLLSRVFSSTLSLVIEYYPIIIKLSKYLKNNSFAHISRTEIQICWYSVFTPGLGVCISSITFFYI